MGSRKSPFPLSLPAGPRHSVPICGGRGGCTTGGQVERSGVKRARRPSLTTLIFLGIGLGILVGLFLGELAAPLAHLGTAFVRLLQMTVLPYVFVSLVLGLGRQQPAQARAIARSGGLWLLVLWGLGIAMVLLLPLSFPDWKSAAFFSSSLVDTSESLDLLGLYIPANPFQALANNLVPAVVVFSISLGVSLIGLPTGNTFLDMLEGANDGLTRIANAVVTLTPIGVFGIAASAAGTISLAELAQKDERMVAFLNRWIELQRQDGTLEYLHEYWIQGREAEQTTPRWSVIRNVLGWVD